MGAAVIGFFIGTGRSTLVEGASLPDQPRIRPAQGDAAPATAYSDMNARMMGPNRGFRTHIESLIEAPHEEPVLDPAAKLMSLQMRAARRAYNGAPPVVPHEIDQLSSEACLVCHESGLRLAETRASRMPHPYLSACTQCHVEQLMGGFDATLVVHSLFEGKPAPFEGPRAYPAAPPVIPHTTHMRSECLACHGPNGPPGMRTTHPERQSCMQCHAPSATLDQRLVTEIVPLLPPIDVQESAQ